MTDKKWLPHVVGITSLVVFIALGLACATTPATAPQAAPARGYLPTGVPWSNYTSIPSKDYVVVGAVVVRETSLQTVHADLIEQAIAMGGHDIINVRLGRREEIIVPAVGTPGTFGYTSGITRDTFIATAVAIRFTDESIVVDETMVPIGATFFAGGPARVPWANHTLIPSKGFIVVGTAVVRNSNPWEVHADFMDRVIQMGGHDIINVLLSWHDNQTVTATAVAIQYTDEIVVVEATAPVTATALPTLAAAPPPPPPAPAAEQRPRRTGWLLAAAGAFVGIIALLMM